MLYVGHIDRDHPSPLSRATLTYSLIYLCLPMIYLCRPMIYLCRPMIYLRQPMSYLCRRMIYLCQPMIYVLVYSIGMIYSLSTNDLALVDQ